MLTIHYREAGIDDKPIVYELMQELIKELSSDSSVKEFLEKLETDIDIALSRDDIVFILAELGDEVIGLARGDILYQDPIFRLRSRPAVAISTKCMCVRSIAEAGLEVDSYRNVNAG